jgi:hypothetical protein
MEHHSSIIQYQLSTLQHQGSTTHLALSPRYLATTLGSLDAALVDGVQVTLFNANQPASEHTELNKWCANQSHVDTYRCVPVPPVPEADVQKAVNGDKRSDTPKSILLSAVCCLISAASCLLCIPYCKLPAVPCLDCHSRRQARRHALSPLVLCSFVIAVYYLLCAVCSSCLLSTVLCLW